jgi:hypothetical protein
MTDPVAAFRFGLHEAAVRRARRRRRRVALAIVSVGIIAAAGTGLAVAATDWIVGDPAPPAAVSDFGGYATQLGFHPKPGEAVVVASDNEVTLFATGNREGTYCIAVSAPWKRVESLPDGGTCVSNSRAAAPFIVGVVGASPWRVGERGTVLVAGRIRDSRGAEIRFTDVAGHEIARPVGSSGFFVASVLMAHPCDRGDWTTTFIATSSAGDVVGRWPVVLAHEPRQGVCVFTSVS